MAAGNPETRVFRIANRTTKGLDVTTCEDLLKHLSVFILGKETKRSVTAVFSPLKGCHVHL